MEALSLDFLQNSTPRRVRGVPLFIGGVFALSLVLFWRADLQDKMQTLESQATGLERQAKGLAPVAERIDESVVQEVQRANEVIDQLSLPWDRLFRAVENVATGPVTLLGIAPDARNGSVQISAESTGSEAMFDYVKRLEQQPELANVYLIEHQRDKRGGVRPLRFLVTASWLAIQNRR